MVESEVGMTEEDEEEVEEVLEQEVEEEEGRKDGGWGLVGELMGM